MTTIIGTCHFVSFAEACRYYSAQGFGREAVRRKLDAGEISLGKPPGDSLLIIDEGTRYAISKP